MTKIIIECLTNGGVTPNYTLGSEFAKQVVEEVRLDTLRKFPELSTHVPAQFLEKDTYSIVRVAHAARRKRRAATLKSRTSRAETLVPPAATTAPKLSSLPLSSQFDLFDSQTEPIVFDSAATKRPPAKSLIPVSLLANNPPTFDIPEDAHPERLLFNQPDGQAETTYASPASSSTLWPNNPTLFRSLATIPSLSGLNPAPYTKVHKDLREIQLCALVLDDRKDSSIINLGELLLRNDRREKSTSCSSLEDITDQDWEYYHSTYFPSDLGIDFHTLPPISSTSTMVATWSESRTGLTGARPWWPCTKQG